MEGSHARARHEALMREHRRRMLHSQLALQRSEHALRDAERRLRVVAGILATVPGERPVRQPASVRVLSDAE
jgi:hypothetical protein